MKIGMHLLGFAATIALVGCVAEPVPVTTTTVTREVTTTTGPATTVAPAADEVFVTQAPPRVRVETRTLSPGRGYVWNRGYWHWTGRTYVWVSGRWVRPQRPGSVWVEGTWVRRPGGWVWVEGRWQ